MAIKARKANKLATNDEGYVTAELADITETTYLDDKSDSETDQLLFDFIAEGSVKPIIFKVWTGVVISSEKNYIPHSKAKPEFNKLTQLCLALKVLNDDELETFSEDELAEKLEALRGIKVQFKTIPSKKSPGLNSIDIKTLTRV